MPTAQHKVSHPFPPLPGPPSLPWDEEQRSSRSPSCLFAIPPMPAHVADPTLGRGALYSFTYFLEFLESKGEVGAGGAQLSPFEALWP